MADNNNKLSITIADGQTYLVQKDAVDVDVYRHNENALTFTATQVGGTDGTKLSTGIETTFSGSVDDLTANSITLSGAGVTKGALTGSGNTYLLAVEGYFANRTVCAVTIAGWAGAQTHYAVSGPQNVTLYNDAQTYVTFTAEEFGGVSGQIRTKAVILTFSEPVSGLSLSDITIHGAMGTELTQIDDEGRKWLLNINGIGVKDGEKITLSISAWMGYNVTTSNVVVPVYVPGIISYTAQQIGGVDGSAPTTGILLTFSETVILTTDDVALTNSENAEVGYTLTNNDDENGATWLLEITPTSHDTYRLQVGKGTYPDYQLNPGSGAAEKRVKDSVSYVRVYKDMREHFTYTVTQIGGKDGIADTTHLEIKVAHVDNEYFRIHPGLNFSISVGGGAVLENFSAKDPSMPDDSQVMSNYAAAKIRLLPEAKNGGKITVELFESDSNTRVPIVFDDAKKEVTIFRDTRVRTGIKKLTEVGGVKGVSDSTGILIEMQKPLAEGFSLEHIKLINATPIELTDAGDDDGRTWLVKIEDIAYS